MKSWHVSVPKSSVYPLYNHIYTLLTLKYGVNLLNAPVYQAYWVKMHARFWLRLGVRKCVFPLRYSETHSLLQIISHSDTKVTALVVMEYKRASVLHVYEMIFLLHTSRSTGYKELILDQGWHTTYSAWSGHINIS